MSIFEDEEAQLILDIAASNEKKPNRVTVTSVWNQAYSPSLDSREVLQTLLQKAQEALNAVEAYAISNDLEFTFHGSKRNINDTEIRILNDSKFFSKSKRKANK
jgi:hypothetical protein